MMLQDPAGYTVDSCSLSSDHPNIGASTFYTCDPFSSLIILSLQGEIFESV